jgi:hypothetical protein
MMRYIFFVLAVLVGVGGGLYYGWIVSPVEFVDTSPDTLRLDYKADYVLMVAEAYAIEEDADMAVRRLALLAATSPLDSVQSAAVFGLQAGFSPIDLLLLDKLADALKGYGPALEAPSP